MYVGGFGADWYMLRGRVDARTVELVRGGNWKAMLVSYSCH
jgi:hypothetical protein